MTRRDIKAVILPVVPLSVQLSLESVSHARCIAHILSELGNVMEFDGEEQCGKM